MAHYLQQSRRLAHKLSIGDLVRALKALACAPVSRNSAGCVANGKSLGFLRLAVEALLTCLSPQIGGLGLSVVLDAFCVMAATAVQEQTFLDMLLVQLLVIMRRDRVCLTPAILGTVADAIGRLHDSGLSAKRAASGSSSAANRRCIEALSDQIVGSLSDFNEEELARLGGAFVVSFLDDVQRRAVLRRAAELGVGLQPSGNTAYLAVMQRLEVAVRQHSFAFVASLPDETKDYLMRLKAASVPSPTH